MLALETVIGLIGIQLADQYYFPYESDRPFASLSEVARELTDSQVTEWDGAQRLQKSQLADKYDMLYLASCSCLFYISHMSDCDVWRARFLYAMGTGKPICVVLSYISYLASIVVPEKVTTSVKSAWIVRLTCDRARVLLRDNEPLVGSKEGPFSSHAGSRSEGQIFGSKRRRVDLDVRPERPRDDVAQDSPDVATTSRGSAEREAHEASCRDTGSSATPEAERERELTVLCQLSPMSVSIRCFMS